MTKHTIPVMSGQQLTPRAVEVIRAVVDSSFPEHEIKFTKATPSHPKVLVFGNVPEGTSGLARDFVYTYSVAQIMTKANAASVLKAGIQQMITEAETAPFSSPEFSYLPESALSKFDFFAPIAIDIETDGNLGKTHTPEEVRIISLALYQAGRAPVVIVEPNRVLGTPAKGLNATQLRCLANVLPKFTKAIYHNGKFDIRVLNRVLDVELVNWFDTMLAHHVLNQAAGDHKLKTLARRYLGAPEWEADLGKYTKGGGHYENIPEWQLVEYNGWDVYWTYKLYEFLAPQLEADEEVATAFAFEMAAAEFLLEVEKYGIPFDTEYADDFSGVLSADQARILLRLQQFTGTEGFNPNSPKQVKDYFHGRGHGIGSTDEATLTELMDTLDPANMSYQTAELILEYRGLAKKNGTYAQGWLNKSRDGRVHPTFLVHGTSTGRLSSTSPNAQNVPRDKQVRKIVRTHG